MSKAINIVSGLFLGSENSYYSMADKILDDPSWLIVQCAKDPFHRQAVGYTTRSAPSGPEYLVAIRGNRTILNIVDGDNPNLFPVPLINFAVEQITKALLQPKNVLVHCNRGESRSPTIAMLSMVKMGIINAVDFENLETKFRMLYPMYSPSRGIRIFAKQYFEKVLKG